MQLKPSVFQLAIVWAVISLLATACGPSVNCDDPGTPQQEVCSSGGSSGVYYRSGGSSFVRGYQGGSSVRGGFGKTGGGRSGFG